MASKPKIQKVKLLDVKMCLKCDKKPRPKGFFLCVKCREANNNEVSEYSIGIGRK